MLITGDFIDTETASRYGLVECLVDADNPNDANIALMGSIFATSEMNIKICGRFAGKPHVHECGPRGIGVSLSWSEPVHGPRQGRRSETRIGALLTSVSAFSQLRSNQNKRRSAADTVAIFMILALDSRRRTKASSV